MTDPSQLLDAMDRIMVRLEQCTVTDEESHDVWTRARQLNGRLWGFIRSVEAFRISDWYNQSGILRAIANEGELSTGEVWGQLADSGAVSVRTSKLLKVARDMGVDTTRFEEGANDEG